MTGVQTCALPISDLFELYGATRALVRALEPLAGDEWRSAGITAEQMVVRGQMGRYWTALTTGAP